MAVDLTEDELQLLSSLPQAIGSAVAFCGRSGLFGTGKEMFVNAQAMMAGAEEFPDNELIRTVVPDAHAADRSAELAQAKKTRDWVGARLKAKGITSPEMLTALTLDDCREAAKLLAAKFDAKAVGEYKQWAISVAEKVAMASTEGGFLGFGGERLSEPERKLIADLKSALDLSAA